MCRLVVSAILLVLFSPMSTAAESAQDVLSKMAQAYASLESYSDSGVVLVRFRADATPEETTFETAFARPMFFRFAWVSHHPYPPLRHLERRSVIWFDGTAAYLKSEGTSEVAKIEPQKSLSSAVAGATGVSAGSAHHVVRLLMPAEISGFSLKDLKAPTLETTEDVEGTSCHHIRGTTPQGVQIDIWVAATDHLIRRIKMRELEETHRDIRIDQTIPSSRFSP
jgi:outer membrane lipoprotein-sorting protein